MVAVRPTAPATPLRTTSQGQVAACAIASGPAMTSGIGWAAALLGAGRRGGQRGPDVGLGAGPGHRDPAGPELDGLLGQQGRVTTPGGQPGDPEPVRVTPDHVQGLGADRSGRAEDDDIARFHGPIVPVDAPAVRPDSAQPALGLTDGSGATPAASVTRFQAACQPA